MKRILMLATCIILTVSVYSQKYGTIDYMGKKKQITSDFFEYFNFDFENSEYTNFRPIYLAIVDLLKNSETILYVDESKSITWTSPVHYPYCADCKVKKYYKGISAGIMYRVLLTRITYFVTHDK
jgi:hypothetical protein